jgi:hypothetical protein
MNTVPPSGTLALVEFTRHGKEIVVETLTLDHPVSRTLMRRVRLLVGGYLTLSLLTVVAIVLLRDHPDLVPPQVWVRGIIVAAAALLMTLFVRQTTRGSRRSYLRLRLTSAIMLVAIIVIIALPGDFPLWMKVEQGLCGVLLLGVVALINGRRLRSLFA